MHEARAAEKEAQGQAAARRKTGAAGSSGGLAGAAAGIFSYDAGSSAASDVHRRQVTP